MKLLQKIIFAAAILLPHSISAMTYYAIDKPKYKSISFGSEERGGAVYLAYFTDRSNQNIAIVSRVVGSQFVDSIEIPPYITVGKNPPITYKVVGIGGQIKYTIISDDPNYIGSGSTSTIECDGFKGAKYTYNVKLPNTIKEIPDDAFNECKYLKTIDLPDSLISIGNHAFQKCTSLKSINIPASVTTIGYQAFRECKNLESINIPASVTTIGYQAFLMCVSLQQIDVDKNNQLFSLANGMLYDVNKARLIACNPKQESITIPEPIKYIDARFFEDNTYIKSVTLPSTLVEIEPYTFSGCRYLESISPFPKSLTKIGDYAFQDCYNLRLNSDTFSQSSITEIGRSAFNCCSSSDSFWIKASQLYLPNTLRKIGDLAFRKCRIDVVSLPISLEEIGDRAFYDCKISSITIPASLSKIGNYTFYNTNITSISLPNSLYEIGDYTFAKCEYLRSVTLPNSLSRIGNGTFAECKFLNSVTLPNSLDEIGDSTFYNTCVTSITLPNSLNRIGNATFMNTKMNSITLPDKVTVIGDDAFSGCERLSSIYLSKTLTKIGDRAFSHTNLKSVSLPKTLEKIGDRAFEYTNLKSVSLPESLVSLGAEAFYDSYYLESIHLPQTQTLKKIGADALNQWDNRQLNIYAYWTTDVPKFSHNIVMDYVGEKNYIRCCDEHYGYYYNNKKTLYVPKGYTEYYKQREPWGHFKKIVEVDYADIDDVEAEVAGSNNENSSCEVFNLSGCHVASGENLESARSGLVNGIYIIRFTNGQTRKIVI